MNNNYKECPNYEQLECFDCKIVGLLIVRTEKNHKK